MKEPTQSSRIEDAIIHVLSVDSREAALRALSPFPAKQWRRIHPWLDASGLALYLHHHLQDLDALAFLPRPVLERLSDNLAQNRDRTEDIFREMQRLQDALQLWGVDYVVLKGLALIPQACPDPTLRLQIDIDILVSGASLPRVQHALSALDYTVSAVSKNVWEFRTPALAPPQLRDIYKPKRQRTIDVHFLSAAQFQRIAETRIDKTVNAQRIPTLSPVDSFLHQATHLAKHLRGEFTRPSWLFEFRNTVAFHRQDSSFWLEVGERVRADAAAAETLGAAIAITRRLFSFASLPDVLREVESSLRPGLQLWIERYGRAAVTAGFPGTKLYLLQPFAPGVPTNAGTRLVPFRLPARSDPMPATSSRWLRARAQLTYIRYGAMRAGFHLREGLRYLVESARWKRLLAEQHDVQATTEPIL